LVFSSTTKSVAEIQDLALNRVRPLFATLPGVSAPPPFGGAARTIVVSVDPDRLRAYRMAPEEVIRRQFREYNCAGRKCQNGQSVAAGPDQLRCHQHQGFAKSPIRTGAGPTVFLRDIGTIDDASDIITGYAEVMGGERSISGHEACGRFDAERGQRSQSQPPTVPDVVPSDIKIDYEFDQSSYVRNSLLSVVREGLLGALSPASSCSCFCGMAQRGDCGYDDSIALLTAVVALWGAGQTVNIMTPRGLALAVESGRRIHVVMENIHNHLGQGEEGFAVLEASKEVQVLACLRCCVFLAVFCSVVLYDRRIPRVVRASRQLSDWRWGMLASDHVRRTGQGLCRA